MGTHHPACAWAGSKGQGRAVGHWDWETQHPKVLGTLRLPQRRVSAGHQVKPARVCPQFGDGTGEVGGPGTGDTGPGRSSTMVLRSPWCCSGHWSPAWAQVLKKILFLPLEA